MIQIRSLNYTIKQRIILEEIDLDIRKGDFAVIIGPNGAGKSTLLKLMLNLLPLQNGSIHINGVTAQEYLKNNQVGYLPQFEDFPPDFPMKVIDLVLMGRIKFKKLFRSFTDHDRKIAFNSLEMVNIGNLSNRTIGNLSGGEFQRVLLARALATESDYIFLDEPEAGIDKSGIKDFYELLSEQHQRGKTIIAVSHDLERLKNYCNLVLCLDRRIHQHACPEGSVLPVIHEKRGGL